MIDWILSNLEKVIPILLVLFWLLRGRTEEAVEEEPRRAPPSAPARPADRAAGDSTTLEEDVNVRRIQEEIRRRIDERHRQQRTGSAKAGSQPTSAPAQPLLGTPSVPQRVDDANYGRIEDAAAAPDDLSDAGVYSEPVPAAASVEDRLRQLEQYRLEMEQLSRSTVDASLRAALIPVPSASPTAPRARGALVSLLRDPSGLREAVVAREVLGPPVSLR